MFGNCCTYKRVSTPPVPASLLDSMVVNFVTKFPRGVVWYWYWNWNWFWIWFLKIYADGPLQKVFLSISTDIHDGQFQGREWKSSWCTSYGQVIWTDIHAGYNWGPKKSQNKHRTNYGQIQYLIPILGYALQIINFDWHMYWIKLGSNPIPNSNSEVRHINQHTRQAMGQSNT